MLEIVYFTTAAGRSQAIDFMSALQSGEAALVLSDIEAVATHGFRAPASVKTIKGHRPLCEIRTGRYRTFFAILDGRLVVMWSSCTSARSRTNSAESKRRIDA